MKKILGSIVAVAGLALAANAQDVNTQLKYEVSTDGTNWSSSLNVAPGTSVQVRALLSYIGPGTAAGIGQVIFQPVVSNWTAADSLLTTAGTPGNMGVGPVGGTRSNPIGTVSDQPGVWGRITPFGAAAYNTSTYLRGHIGTGTAAGLLRIARADVTNWIGEGATSGALAANNWNGGGGVNIGQIANPSRLSTDPAFDSRSSNVVVFKFGFTVSSATAIRTLGITTPAAGIGRQTAAGATYGQQNARWFASTTEVSSSLTGAVQTIDAAINVVPAPASLALLGLGGLVATRRRR
ncbi:MAG: PEP-CTERM sorting domain-containing protein [Phycisphaerales bacterium]|jgi:hypothetical protein